MASGEKRSRQTLRKSPVSKQRQILLLQGRCFNCRKKGHVAKLCPLKQTAKTPLGDLPVELLELICEYVVEKEYGSPVAFSIAPLRLVCRKISTKLYDYFAWNYFRTLGIHISTRDLQRVSEIAESTLAARVERLCLFSYDKSLPSEEAYNNALSTVRSPETSGEIRIDLERKMWRAHQEQDDQAFIECSGTLGIVLASAMSKMRNVQGIFLACTRSDRRSLRRRTSGRGESTTQIFSTVIASLAHAALKPHTFQVDAGSSFDCYDGVSLQALSMPRNVLECLSHLRNLEIVLESREEEVWKNPDTWDTRASTFLACCQKLVSLKLGFQRWDNTERVFSKIANQVQLSELVSLTLSGIRCEGQDLIRFLKSHTSLEALVLEDLSINDSKTFADVLGVIEADVTVLKRFECQRIAQNSCRTFFETLGQLEIRETRYLEPTREDEVLDEANILNGFVEVIGPFKYAAIAEEWEGVQEKVGLLREDLRVTTTHYMPEHEGSLNWWRQWL